VRDLGHRVRSVWRTLWRSKQLETDTRDEMRFHIQMEAERLTRGQGLDAEEARRQAYVRLGCRAEAPKGRTHTTATFTLWIGGSESNRQSHFSPPSLPIHS
jgi:hypothetical protein